MLYAYIRRLAGQPSSPPALLALPAAHALSWRKAVPRWQRRQLGRWRDPRGVPALMQPSSGCRWVRGPLLLSSWWESDGCGGEWVCPCPCPVQAHLLLLPLCPGVGIVSPQWVAQSLRAGKQQRCLTVSADASRHLPAAMAAAGSDARGGSDAGSGGSTPSPAQQLSASCLPAGRRGKRMLGPLAVGAGAAGAGAALGGTGTVAPLAGCYAR